VFKWLQDPPGYFQTWVPAVLAAAAVVVGLIGMNYHFVGDVVAGGFAGAIVGVYVAHGFGLALARRASEGPAAFLAGASG
jgi:hypothetical protein